MATVGENGTGIVMPVGPTGGFGGLGNDGGWWIILLVILFAGVGGRGYGGNGGGYVDPSYAVQTGFNQASLTSGIAGVQTSLVSGFADVNSALCNGFAQAQIAANARQMADMQQNFALQSQLSQYCCDNKAAIADVKYTIAQENCADRQAVNDALVNLTNQLNAGIQSIKDEFCADRLARKDEIIAELRQQINERDRLASQSSQTAQIEAGQRMLANEIEQYVRPQANPAYIVANPNCCPNYSYGNCNRRVA